MATGAKQVEEFGAAVAGLLAQAIAAQKITFRELGEQSGVHYSQLNLMTRGIKTMTLDEFVRICKALTLDPVEIFERAEDALEEKGSASRDVIEVDPLSDLLPQEVYGLTPPDPDDYGVYAQRGDVEAEQEGSQELP